MQLTNIIKPIITIRKNTTKEIAEAIASIELEQVINEMCYEIDK